jgi:hypothetical protein
LLLDSAGGLQKILLRDLVLGSPVHLGGRRLARCVGSGWHVGRSNNGLSIWRSKRVGCNQFDVSGVVDNNLALIYDHLLRLVPCYWAWTVKLVSLHDGDSLVVTGLKVFLLALHLSLQLFI